VYDPTRRSLAALVLLAGFAASATADAAGCVPPPGRYDYTIDVSGVGRVGALTGLVRRANGATTIDVETQIVVRLAGIVMHRHVETRHTEWRDGRLARYTARVRSNGGSETVDVVRDGGRLAATRNGIRSTLPGDAAPGFPWARCIVDGPRIFGLRSLEVSPVAVSATMPLSLSIDGRDVPAHEVRFASPASWAAWFADDGTLLRHVFENGGRRVTMTRVRPRKTRD
jgi:hypothetical protein